MKFSFSADQDEFRRSVRRFLESRVTPAARRALIDSPSGFDMAVWRQMSDQLGLPGLAVSEAFGGQGFGMVEVGIVLEEMGRVLMSPPYLSTAVLTVYALSSSGDGEAMGEYLPRIASGDLLGTVALAEGDSWTSEAITTRAENTAVGYRLTGTKTYVSDAAIADLLVVPARTPEGLGLFVVERGAAGLSVSPLTGLDLTRRFGEVVLEEVPARLIAAPQGGSAVVDHLLQVGSVALSCELVGAAQCCLEMAVEYAKTRVQFGKPIGSFQAIKHKAADVHVGVEGARSAAYYAARCVDSEPDDLPLAASLAKACCSEAAFRAAAENIQIHGGIGFTWEHDAHLYYRRARSDAWMFGSAEHHRAVLAGHLGV